MLLPVCEDTKLYSIILKKEHKKNSRLIRCQTRVIIADCWFSYACFALMTNCLLGIAQASKLLWRPKGLVVATDAFTPRRRSAA